MKMIKNFNMCALCTSIFPTNCFLFPTWIVANEDKLLLDSKNMKTNFHSSFENNKSEKKLRWIGFEVLFVKKKKQYFNQFMKFEAEFEKQKTILPLNGSENTIMWLNFFFLVSIQWFFFHSNFPLELVGT